MNNLWIKNFKTKVLKKSKSIILEGCGPIGIELAGEIRDIYPTKKITIIHNKTLPLNERLDYNFRLKLKELLEVNSIDYVTTGLDDEQKTKETILKSADLTIPCYGFEVNSKWLEKSEIELNNGSVVVDEFLRVKNYQNVFVVGDLIDLPSSKTLINAKAQIANVFTNIINLNENIILKPYKIPKTEMMSVIFGESKGLTFLPVLGGIYLGNFFTSKIKGKSILIEKYIKMLR